MVILYVMGMEAVGINQILRLAAMTGLLGLMSGCAHAPKASLGLKGRFKPRELLQLACSPGAGVTRVSGSARMALKSKEATGHFTAMIQASAPGELKLEVTRPLGGTYAILTVHGSDYTIQVPGHPERDRKGSESWAGIPLKWATQLFLGRIPCPDSDLSQKAGISISPDDELDVDVPPTAGQEAQEFIYRFRARSGSFWPEGITWRSGGLGVDFQFDDPDPDTLSPRKWVAKSARGEIKTDWRDRQMVR